MDEARAAKNLLAWFSREGRHLPWRRRHHPYDVLLAEFILQQTRMETGLRYYRAIRRRFPTVHDLARARPETVLALWSGLGYYARARNLHAAARAIVRDHGGRVPSEPSALRRLPGIGPYTAGAIMSIAYDRPEPSLDGNQFRVFQRVLGTSGKMGPPQRRRIERAARALLRKGSPRRLNQALMDLGSSICLPEAPDCARCPLGPDCRSRGMAPRAHHRRAGPTPIEHWEASIHRSGDAIWLREPRETGLLAGLWLPPLRRARRRFRNPDLVHAFSHKVWKVRTIRPPGPPPRPGRWVNADQVARLPHGRLTAQILRRELLEGPPRPTGSRRHGDRTSVGA